MSNIIPYIKKKEEHSRDNRVPLYIQPDYLERKDYFEEKRENSIKNNNDIDVNVDFTIKDFEIKF